MSLSTASLGICASDPARVLAFCLIVVCSCRPGSLRTSATQPAGRAGCARAEGCSLRSRSSDGRGASRRRHQAAAREQTRRC